MHIAVITEYNPFHMGHEYQLAELRRAFPEATVTAIMGGIFSQRGEPYVTTPYVRAEAALMCGADLVLELPFPYSCAPASVFARAGVEIAAKAGADVLAFGSECGDVEKLKIILARLENDKFLAAVKATESSALGKTRTYAAVYSELYGEDCASEPNDILALEYLRAIKNGGYSIEPYTIKRIGDFKSGEGGFASATSIRGGFAESGMDALAGSVPTAAEAVYKKAYENGLFGADIEKLSSAVLLKLCTCEESDIAFSSGGLLGRLKSASEKSKSIADLRALAATKRYTDAEISRCILYATLGVKRCDMAAPVHFARVFGATERGRAVLGKNNGIELITKPSATEKLSRAAREQYEKTFVAERAFALCLDGEYNHLKQTPIII